jgi:hypothetical protein
VRNRVQFCLAPFLICRGHEEPRDSLRFVSEREGSRKRPRRRDARALSTGPLKALKAMASRSPLATANVPACTPVGAVPRVAAKTPASTPKPPAVSADTGDKALLVAVSRCADSMMRLGADSLPRYAAGSGAAALRALGHDIDGNGNAIYEPATGSISRQLLDVQDQLARERAARQQAQQDVDRVSAAYVSAHAELVACAQRDAERMSTREQQAAAGLAAAQGEVASLRDELSVAQQHVREAQASAEAALRDVLASAAAADECGKSARQGASSSRRSG